MSRESLRIPVDHAGVEWVSAVLHEPAEDAGRSVVLLAHGAAMAMDSELIVGVAGGLAARGLPVLRFNYAYAERSSREGEAFPPDRADVLLAVHHGALDALTARYAERRTLLAGKSLGARMSSQLAAQGAECAGLVHLGYPLHPPGRPETLRSGHFPDIAVPSLFLQGTRDALCDLELLRTALETYGGTATLREIEGGDHSLEVPEDSGRTPEDVLEEIVDAIAEWERTAISS